MTLSKGKNVLSRDFLLKKVYLLITLILRLVYITVRARNARLLVLQVCLIRFRALSFSLSIFIHNLVFSLNDYNIVWLRCVHDVGVRVTLLGLAWCRSTGTQQKVTICVTGGFRYLGTDRSGFLNVLFTEKVIGTVFLELSGYRHLQLIFLGTDCLSDFFYAWNSNGLSGWPTKRIPLCRNAALTDRIDDHVYWCLTSSS